MSDNSNENWNEMSPEERPYHRVPLPNPSEKDYEEWNVNERRAYLLDKIQNDYGLPDSVPRVEMGKKFGVSHAQIYQDIQVLQGYMSEYLDANFEAEAFSLFKSSMRMLQEEDPYKAVQVLEKYSSWLEDRGEVENESEDTVRFETSDDMSVSFNVVSDDDTDEDGSPDSE